MASIRKISTLFSIAFLIIVFPLRAQTVNMAFEIERLEKLAQTPGYKIGALTRMAKLYQLSGNREKALENWMAAVYAEPGRMYEHALLESVKLLISMGEFDRAAAGLRTILISTQDPGIRQSALYLYPQLEAFRTGEIEPLGLLAEEPQSRLFYLLWKITNDNNWKSKLFDSFPQSIEAEILKENSRVNAACTPQWIFGTGNREK